MPGMFELYVRWRVFKLKIETVGQITMDRPRLADTTISLFD